MILKWASPYVDGISHNGNRVRHMAFSVVSISPGPASIQGAVWRLVAWLVQVAHLPMPRRISHSTGNRVLPPGLPGWKPQFPTNSYKFLKIPAVLYRFVQFSTNFLAILDRFLPTDSSNSLHFLSNSYKFLQFSTCSYVFPFCGTDAYSSVQVPTGS